MKKTLIALALLGTAAGGAGALELERLGLRSLPVSAVESPAVSAPEKILADTSWAREAAKELRKELRELGVEAKVTVLPAPVGDVLQVEFLNRADYERISDLFYQDPGAPSYMDVKVVVKIGAGGEKADRTGVPQEATKAETDRFVKTLLKGLPGGCTAALDNSYTRPYLTFTDRNKREMGMMLEYTTYTTGGAGRPVAWQASHYTESALAFGMFRKVRYTLEAEVLDGTAIRVVITENTQNLLGGGYSVSGVLSCGK